MKNKFKTTVIFRRYKRYHRSVIALFPYEMDNPNKGYVMCYEHYGQHSGADYNHIVSMTTLATEEEYTELKEELEEMGYNLKVAKKINYEKYLEAIATEREFLKN